MRLLDRYLLRELVVPLGYCLGWFLIFWITYDLFTELNNFQSRQLGLKDIAEYYVVTAPAILVTVIPIALLLAMLYTLTNLARHHELTAIRAAGVSLWRLTVPCFAVAVAGSGVLFALNELAVPNGAEKAERILNRHTGAQNVDPRWQKSVVFKNERDQRQWHIGAYNVETFEMRKLHLEWRRPDGATRVIDAEGAQYTNGIWMLFTVQEVMIPVGNALAPAPLRAEAQPMPELSETPRLILSEIKISRMDSIKTARKAQLGIREIREYLALHPQLDEHRRDLLLTTLHSRFAAPWTCVVVVLISLPFGAASGRRNVFVGVASSVFICFLFYFLNLLSLALGERASVAPWLAAWAPNIVFGVTGVVMTQRTR